ESVGAGLGRESFEPVHDLRNIVEAAVDNLQLTSAVIGVTHALCQLRHVGAELVGHSQAGSIVAGVIDAVAGGQPLNGLGLKVAVYAQVLLSDERVYVSLNRKRHFSHPVLKWPASCRRRV